MSDAKLMTECCGVTIHADHRFCPKCGYEARTVAPPLTAPFSDQRHCRACGWSGHQTSVMHAGLNHELCPECEATLGAPEESGQVFTATAGTSPRTMASGDRNAVMPPLPAGPVFEPGGRCPCGADVRYASGIGPYCTRTGHDGPCDVTAGPVASPPDVEDLAARFIDAAEAYRIHSELSFTSPISYTVNMMKARNALWAALGEAPRGAARPPQPPELDAESSAADIRHALNRAKLFAFAVLESRQNVGAALRTSANGLITAVDRALHVESAARPPASPPALEALRGATNDLHIAFCELLQLALEEDIDMHDVEALEARADDAMAEIQRALAVAPEAPPP